MPLAKPRPTNFWFKKSANNVPEIVDKAVQKPANIIVRRSDSLNDFDLKRLRYCLNPTKVSLLVIRSILLRLKIRVYTNGYKRKTRIDIIAGTTKRSEDL